MIRQRLRTLTLLVVVATLDVSPIRGSELAVQANAILRQHCYKCHGAEYKVPRLNVLDRDSLIQKRGESAYVIPGNPAASELWSRAGEAQDMPPEDIHERPSAEDLAVLKAWIEAGAPDAVEAPREFVAYETVLDRIANHIKTIPRSRRKNQRYFTLTNLHNNPELSNGELRVYRAAFSKLVNSLSRKGSLVVPTLVDANDEQLIFSIDLAQLGWSLDAWQTVLRGSDDNPLLGSPYPYGLSWRDSDVQTLIDELTEQLGGAVSGDGIPHLRVDWFVRNASRPPAYHQLLGLPTQLDDLENELGVNVQREINNGTVRRAGFAGSGVSRHNRLVDRFVGQSKYYYRSYDFGRSFGDAVLSRFPLGPKADNNPFNQFAFDHDGGEVFFQLPNGLQAYLLVDADGNRLDEAPVKIVRDVQEFSGTPIIVNGISCMGCHKRGTLAYEDQIRATQVLDGQAGERVESIYADNEELETLLDSDKVSFLRALDTVCSPFLEQGVDYGANTPFPSIGDLPDPISTASKLYDRDISASAAAAELHLEPGEFAVAVRLNERLKEFGIAPLSSGGKLPRQLWDTVEESSASVYQRVFQAIGKGAPRQPILSQ